MAAVLKHDVHVTRLVKGEWKTHVPKAGEEVPKNLRKFVTNKKAYVDAEPAPVEAADDTAELVEQLKQRDLPTTGTPDEMRERIAEFDAENGDDTGDDDPASNEDDGEE